jgi:hypothetical protein
MQNFPAALPEHLAGQAEEALKRSYNLKFLGIGQAVKRSRAKPYVVELAKVSITSGQVCFLAPAATI